MPVPNQALPVIGNANSTEDPKILAVLTELQNLLNFTATGLDGFNFGTTLAQVTGVTGGNVTRRGKSIIATTETRSNAAYGLMTTPDRVQSINLPTDGLIYVAYQAMWQEAVSNQARAAIFIGANQVTGGREGFSPVVKEASIGGSWSVNTDVGLCSDVVDGLASHNGAAASGGGTGADVTTGQIIGSVNAGTTPLRGGVPAIFAAAGTYDVSIQFKATSGVTVKNRKLWVWTVGF